MKARNLASPRETLRTDDPASEAARILSRHDVRAVLVVDAEGHLAGVLSDSELLRRLLPAYVEDNEALARVLDEAASEALYQRLEGRTVAELVRTDREEAPVVDGEDTLVEVAAVMVRSRASLVGVVDAGRLIGGISIDDLVSHLLRPR
ncbi:MAG TPA: CBS domain-containing protein [Actinomycetota bacterium]|nr:CBS domain-containing protein [Actinomycetota bacterium]